MAPNVPSTTTTEYLPAGTAPLADNQKQEEHAEHDANSAAAELPAQKDEPYRVQLVWRNIIAFAIMHAGAFYGLYLILTFQIRFYTFLWSVFIAVTGALGVIAGAHRLWSHRAYKAKWPLKLLLTVFQTVAFQNSIYEWSRDHRVHHKYSETDADPHNAARGFFFSHMGWLLCRKHPDVIRKGATVDMSDLKQDPIVMFQHRTFVVLMPLLCFVMPTWVPCYFWGEDGWKSWYVAGLFRYITTLHVTWLVNSAAHIWGYKPYDKNIGPTENKSVGMIALGEGWHNYHHVFPWDYKAAEFGGYKTNLSASFIELCAKMGLAYDLKSVPAELIRRRAERTGDGSYQRRDVEKKKSEHTHHHHDDGETPVWGWGDKDMLLEDARVVLKECRER